MKSLAFTDVEEALGRAMARYRDAVGRDEVAPQAWAAPDGDELTRRLRAEGRLEESLQSRIQAGESDGDVGGAGSRVIAWVYDSNGRNLWRIHEDAEASALDSFLDSCLDYDL